MKNSENEKKKNELLEEAKSRIEVKEDGTYAFTCSICGQKFWSDDQISKAIDHAVSIGLVGDTGLSEMAMVCSGCTSEYFPEMLRKEDLH